MCEDAYLAGVFDGEGSIHLARGSRGYQLCAVVNMVNKGVVAAFHTRFGGGFYAKSQAKARSMGHPFQDQWAWQVTSGSRIAFFKAIQPHLIEKRAQVDLALQYIEEFGEGHTTGSNRYRAGRTSEQKARQQWYYEEFKRLKKVCEGCDDGG